MNGPIKILLTGASGFLGRVIMSNLVEQKLQFVTIGRQSTNKIICDLSAEIPIIGFNNLEVVIHAAGLAHSAPRKKKDSNFFHSVNVIGTSNLLRGLKNIGIPKKFVFFSSVAVYGMTEGENINESTELKATNPYGQSKIEAEKLIFNWCKENNVCLTIFRLPLVVGVNAPGNLGAMINGIKKGYYFNIAGGSAKKSMVLASDVAKYLLKASEIGGIYNLTDGYHPSFFELSENISRQLGKSRSKNLPFWLAKGLARTGDLFGYKAPLNTAKLYQITSDLTFDDSKSREAFGWDPTPVLERFKTSDKN
jgi:nucleoside-diphosphate-sugar epimerase